MEKITDSIMVGRQEEIKTLNELLLNKQAELVAVTGRRRIGKTYLVNTIFREQIVFDMIGSQNAATETQLQNFSEQLKFYKKTKTQIAPPNNWSEAFMMLRNYLQTLPKKNKPVIFIDELPWLAGQKSGFLGAFSYFWNAWASQQKLVVVICGSAASWMLQKVVNDKGGLHNRITKHIHLEPFTLTETKQFLASKKVYYNHYQIIQLFLAIGGIPHYLKEIDGKLSAIQNINKLCFTKNGLLYDEFDRLYASLFAHADLHIDIVNRLATKKQGMTRNELAEKTRVKNGGGLTNVLNELVLSGFITEIFPYGKQKKDKILRLTDEYSLFYLQFMKKNRRTGKGIWQQLSQTPSYTSWAGYAFESLCIKHVEKIKQALGISGIYTTTSSFYQKGVRSQKGVQIDMLIDRTDQTINLLEIKFHNKPFAITKKYANDLQEKLWRFQEITKQKKQVNWVLISSFGLIKNEYSLDIINNDFNMDILF